MVPRDGNIACMSTRAATGCIIDAESCDSPDGILQKSVRAGTGMVTVQLENIYSPGLKISHYRMEGTRIPPTLDQFGTGQIVLPIQMLKEHLFRCDTSNSNR